jgi:hypothetical protein
MEVPLNGGIGYVVLFGGLEITGVLLLFAVSVPLHETHNVKSAIIHRLRRFCVICGWLVRKEDTSVLVVELILNCGSIILFLWHSFTWDTILTFDPATEIDKLATLRTEGTKRVVFPLDWLTAGWTFHES